METICPITDLHRNTKEVRAAAREGVVRVTEGGRAAFVFCSEEVFGQRLKEAADEAVYAERVAASIRAGRADIAEGRSFEGTGAILDAIDRAARG